IRLRSPIWGTIYRRLRLARRRWRRSPYAKCSPASSAPVRSCDWRARHIRRARRASAASGIRSRSWFAPLSALFFVFGQIGTFRAHGRGEPPPDWAFWHDRIALAQKADAKHIHWRDAAADSCQKRRRAATAAKGLDPRNAAVRRLFYINVGLTGDL